MKRMLTTGHNKALGWIIAGLLIALMPSVALACELEFSISDVSPATPHSLSEVATQKF